MLSFIGNIDARVDAKGRAFVPAQFRKQLGENIHFVLRKGVFEDCLVLYPESTWEEIIGVLRSKLSRWNRQEEQLFRQFVAEADHIELEENGRMLIPKRMIEAVGIQNDIRFVGCDSSIEIWPVGKVEEGFKPADDFAEALGKLMQSRPNESGN